MLWYLIYLLWRTKYRGKDNEIHPKRLIIPSGMMIWIKWTQPLLLLKLAVLQNIQEVVRDEPLCIECPVPSQSIDSWKLNEFGTISKIAGPQPNKQSY